jgi:hypothetical protein
MTVTAVSRRAILRTAGIAITLALFVMPAAASAQAPTLSVRPSPAYTAYIAPGSQVAISWSGIASPSTTDWIGVYQAAAADTAYLQWTYTTGASSGTKLLTLSRGLRPGAYELRLFVRNSYTRVARMAFTIVPQWTGVSLVLRPSVYVRRGQLTTVEWWRIIAPSAYDWIGFYPRYGPSNVPITWFYTGGSSTGSRSFTIPTGIAPGLYELRLFSDNSYAWMASVNPIYVQG